MTGVHSVAGTFDAGRRARCRRPPFEDPHHTATPAGGRGRRLRHARARARRRRAHRGVLFLDEAPEFAPRVPRDAARSRWSTASSSSTARGGAARYPARFQLVLAANPCPCGRAERQGARLRLHARSPGVAILSRLSGPLLDRIHIRVEVPAAATGRTARCAGRGVDGDRRRQGPPAARAIAVDRLRDTPWRLNGEVPGPWLRDHTRRATPSLTSRLDQLRDTGRLTLRGVDRVLKVAWTVSDLAGRDVPTESDLAAAVTLRSGGGRG